jgi:hypothetical protein
LRPAALETAEMFTGERVESQRSSEAETRRMKACEPGSNGSLALTVN